MVFQYLSLVLQLTNEIVTCITFYSFFFIFFFCSFLFLLSPPFIFTITISFFRPQRNYLYNAENSSLEAPSNCTSNMDLNLKPQVHLCLPLLVLHKLLKMSLFFYLGSSKTYLLFLNTDL